MQQHSPGLRAINSTTQGKQKALASGDALTRAFVSIVRFGHHLVNLTRNNYGEMIEYPQHIVNNSCGVRGNILLRIESPPIISKD